MMCPNKEKLQKSGVLVLRCAGMLIPFCCCCSVLVGVVVIGRADGNICPPVVGNIEHRRHRFVWYADLEVL